MPQHLHQKQFFLFRNSHVGIQVFQLATGELLLLFLELLLFSIVLYARLRRLFVLFICIYIYLRVFLCLCVCCVRYVRSHVDPFVAWKLTIGLVWSPLRFPYVLPACLFFFGLPSCLFYSLQDILLFFWGAYKSKIFCSLPSKGNCGQICLSTCDISNVRTTVSQRGCPVKN